MQITVFPSKLQTEDQYKIADIHNSNIFPFSNSIISRLPNLFNSGYRTKDIIILVRARKTIPMIQYLLKSANIDQFSFSIFTYHHLAEKILQDFGFLVNKQKFKAIGRHDQLRIVKRICTSQNKLLNYKDVSLFIIKYKCYRCSHSSEEMKFSKFLKNKYHQTNSNKNTLSDFSLDNYFSKIYDVYQETLKNKKLADFEDLLIFSSQIMKHNPEVISFYNRRYKFAFIDNTNKFLTKKKEISNFMSLLFIKNENNHHLQFNHNERDFEYDNSKFQLFALNSFPRSTFFHSLHQTHHQHDLFEHANECNDSNHIRSYTRRNFQSSSEVSDFDFDNDNGVNIDIFNANFDGINNNFNPNEKLFDTEFLNINTPGFEVHKILSDFEEEEDFLSDFEDFNSDEEYESDDSFYNEELHKNRSNHVSSWLIKNNFCLVNSIKKKKYFKNNYCSSNKPIMYSEIEANKRDRRYSYYGQSHFIKDINHHYKMLINQKGMTSFFSDDNYD